MSGRILYYRLYLVYTVHLRVLYASYNNRQCVFYLALTGRSLVESHLGLCEVRTQYLYIS